MYHRILVPLDGSPLAEDVLPYADLLARGLDMPVTLLRTFEVPDAGVAEEQGMHLDAIVEGLRARAAFYLDQVAAPLRDGGLTVECVADEGSAAARIVAEAERPPGTLIAMSSHGRFRISRWILGSVTDAVLHTASSPVLVIRSRDRETPPSTVRFSRLVVPVDGSPLAEQILPHAVFLSKALGLGVTLVRVTPTATSYYIYGPDFMWNQEQLRQAVELDAQTYLADAARILHDQGLPDEAVSTRLLHGDVAGSIIDLAQETPDALIAMTSHGRSGVGRWVLGSIADRVVRNSGDPVLLIRAQPIDEPQQA